MVKEILRHPISILGVLPTFYDQRNRISREAVQTLSDYFKDRVLPPIRVNTRLKEAPSHRLTIFEYASDSSGAQDYMRLVHWLIARNTGVGERALEASIAEIAPELAGSDEPAGPVMSPIGRVSAARAEARS
jgi:nitrogenase subunit NifH